MTTYLENELGEFNRVKSDNLSWFKVPPKVYFKRGSLDLALRELLGKKRAFLVTDSYLFNTGAVDKVTKILSSMNIEYQIFFEIKPNPTLEMIYQAMEVLTPFEPDVIISLGGGSPMDAAKIMWLLYEQPEIDLEKLSMRFMEKKSNNYFISPLGNKATMVAIPTTSGTGSEVAPFSIITNNVTKEKYIIADYELTPNMAIIDPNFVDKMPKELTATTGIDALVHAIEAYISPVSTNFINSNSLEAIKLIFKYLERSYHEGSSDPLAREKMHYAATISGMAFANSTFGLCHYLAHFLEALYGLNHGIANALLIRQVIKYFTIDPELGLENDISKVKLKISQIASELNLEGSDECEKLYLLINKITQLLESLQIPLAIKDCGVSEIVFMDNLDSLLEIACPKYSSNIGNLSILTDCVRTMYVNAYNGIV